MMRASQVRLRITAMSHHHVRRSCQCHLLQKFGGPPDDEARATTRRRKGSTLGRARTRTMAVVHWHLKFAELDSPP